MTSFYDTSASLSTALEDGIRSNRRRRRYAVNKYFTKTGIFLVLGVVILTVLPSKSNCRPVENKYVYGSQQSSSPEHSLEDEESFGKNFEFQRTIISRSSSISSDSDDDVHNLELIKSSNEDKSNEDPLLNNSSMIVKVIVTSSSSSSSSTSTDDDETEPQEETFQYVVDEDDVENQNKSLPQELSTKPVNYPPDKMENQRFNQSKRQEKIPSRPEISPQEDQHADGQLELQKLKRSSEGNSEAVPDIFSAFYSAFTQSTSPSPPKLSFFENNNERNNDSTVAPFGLPQQPYFRTRHLPQRFQSLQHRRRLFRNRQKQLQRRFSPANDEPSLASIASSSSFGKDIESTSIVEDTARKLESLAKKLDKSEKNVGLESTPILPSSLSISSSYASPPVISPSKIAISVAISHSDSESVVRPVGKTSTTRKPAAVYHKEDDDDAKETREKAVAAVKKDAKSESTLLLGQDIEKVFARIPFLSSTSSHFPTPQRLKPLIKTLQDYDGNINNKNSSNKNNFPENFSTLSGRQDEEKVIQHPEKSYNRDKKETSPNAHISNNDDYKLNEANFRVAQYHHGGNSFSKNDVNKENKKNSSIAPTIQYGHQGESSYFVEISAQIPLSSQQRKITRTVSGQIGDPSAFPFNLQPSSNYYLQKQSAQTTTTSSPKIVNWQEPEKVWGEPAQVWGVPAKIWGEPERVWGEPAKVWGNQEPAWNSNKSSRRKQLSEEFIDEMMQSDQPSVSPDSEKNEELAPQGTFVILGDDENEGDSIDGDLGRPLMLHHFTIPPKPKESVSVSTSVSSSVSSSNRNPISRQVAYFHQPKHSSTIINTQFTLSNNSSNSSSLNLSSDNSSSNNPNGDTTQKKSGKKFGYVIEGANVRKYRVEERTSDGYIVGEYGVLNNQNAFLRGVRYTADGTINPRLIHEALMKFLSLRR